MQFRVPKPSGSGAGTVGVVAAGAAAGVDALIGFSRVSTVYVFPIYLFVGMSAAALAALALYGAVWGLVARPLARSRGWDLGATAVGCGYGIVGALALAGLTGQWPAGAAHGADTLYDWSALPWLAPPLIAACVLGAYVGALQAGGGIRTRPLLAGLHLAVPIVLVGAVLMQWLRKTMGLDAILGLGGKLAFDGAALVVVAMCIAAASRGWGRALAWGTGLALMAGPWTLYLTRPSDGRHAEAISEAIRPRYVILIVADTLRADALSSFALTPYRTPAIDALAADGVQFARAYTPGPWTLPGMASVMTGLSPSAHTATHRNSTLPHELKTAAEYFREGGYFTGAVGLNPVLGAHSGFGQGFDEYAWRPAPVLSGSFGGRILGRLAGERFGGQATTTEQLAEAAMRWVDRRAGSPFFLWVHIYDPHLPLEPPARFLPQGAPPSPAIGTRLDGDEFFGVRSGTRVYNESEKAWIRTLYEAEARYVDEQVGRFVDHLKTIGIYEESAIVFLSDHGEEFWEHGSVEHGHTLYNEVLHVPLIVKWPGRAARGRHDGRVALDSVLPTLLDMAGIAYEPEAFSGRSLRGRWQGGEDPGGEEWVHASGMLYYSEQDALFFGRWKYIRRAGGMEELYDLETDPGERDSIAESAPELVEMARGLLAESEASAARLRERYGLDRRRENGVVAPALIDILKSVGYL